MQNTCDDSFPSNHRLLPCIKDCAAIKMDTVSAYAEQLNMTISEEGGGVSLIRKQERGNGLN